MQLVRMLSVDRFEDLKPHAKSFQSPERENVLSCPLHDSLGLMWTPRNLTLDPLHCSPVNVYGGLFSPPFPVIHNQLLCLAHIQGEAVFLAPHCQVSDLLSIGFLIIVGLALLCRQQT